MRDWGSLVIDLATMKIMIFQGSSKQSQKGFNAQNEEMGGEQIPCLRHP